MTFLKSENSLFSRRHLPRLLVAAFLPVVSACGGGSDLACGSGTVQQGDQCVAKAAVEKKDSGSGGEVTDASSETGTPDGAAGMGGGSGGAGGTSGAGGGGGGADAAPLDEIQFGGITSASPANRTPPSGKDAGAIAPDAVRVTWTLAHFPKNPSTPIHYEVQFSTTSGGESSGTKYVSPPGSTSFNVEGLTAAKYYFKVVAVVEGESAVDKVGPTVEKSATPAFDDTPPTFNGATSAVPSGAKGVLVKWRTPATDTQTSDPAGITYRVYWTDDPQGVFQLGAISAPGASEVVVNGLPQPEFTYYFKAIAVDAAGNADKNDVVVQGLTGSDVTAPVFGGCLSASDASATEATVTWAPAFDDTTPAEQIVYKVYASDVTIAHSTPFSALQLVGTFTGGTRGRVSGLNAASNYRFICHASDSFGNEDNNRVIQQVSTVNDGLPPTFGGIGGAVANKAVIGIDLNWPQAVDDQSSANSIVYNIYASSTPGNEDFTKLPLTTATGGALLKTVTKDMLEALRTAETLDSHVSNTTFYFVIRAQDETGNMEKNTKELSATTLVSFEDDVQPIFTGNCAILVCHTVGVDGTNPPIQGQQLDEGAAYTNIVNVVAREGAQLPTPEPNIKRIDATNPDPHASYLWRKINFIDVFGNQMPPPTAQKNLSTEQKLAIENWIRQGAPNN